MWLFSKLFGTRKPRPEPEDLQFLRALAEQEPKPNFHLSSYAGYHYTVKLTFKQVYVEIGVNFIRRKWDFEVREKETHTSLYGYYETWSPPSQEIVNFLQEKFGVWDAIRKAHDKDEEKNNSEKKHAEDVRAKILKLNKNIDT